MEAMVTLGVETLSLSPPFLIHGVGLGHTMFHRAGPVHLLSTRVPLLKQIPGAVGESLVLVVEDSTPTWEEQE